MFNTDSFDFGVKSNEYLRPSRPIPEYLQPPNGTLRSLTVHPHSTYLKRKRLK